MRKEITAIIKSATSQQFGSYLKGHENQGASIDVLSEIQRLLSVKAMSRNKNAQAVLTEIADFDNLHNEALKYAKHLSFPVRNFIKREVHNLVR
ncbi:lysis inhibition; accessory protein [Cronobacter phage S13]|jgi:hypothetical protein|uniref:Lysis inhibition accessory protein n=1 Tax=Cronobacter phage LPCS28 TaxID=2924885 RepID=A0AAE9G9M2_9CAUD|nr:lysis inhibition; accessory protein [Cronobacter phage S13]YP_010665890.1 lysis inhibition; accessory protein [Cronobacter phage LPCS28]AIA64838.1 putative lysis inhibition accessory protein [Cronobacter phage S13]UNY47079.1 hypothetical protein EHEKIMEA_00197 [Cronobacter phage LPCS28]